MAEKLRGTRSGSQHRGACAPRPAKRRAGCLVRKGVAPSYCEGPGSITPGKFLKTQMLNPAFWRLLCLLVGFRRREISCFLKTTAKKLGDLYIVGPPI